MTTLGGLNLERTLAAMREDLKEGRIIAVYDTLNAVLVLLAERQERGNTFRGLVREANAMLGRGIDPESEWGDWRRRAGLALTAELDESEPS